MIWWLFRGPQTYRYNMIRFILCGVLGASYGVILTLLIVIPENINIQLIVGTTIAWAMAISIGCGWLTWWIERRALFKGRGKIEQ